MKEVEYTQYKEFSCAKDAEEWAHIHFSDVFALPKDSFTYQSVLFYTGSMSGKWNRTLRRCPPIESGDFEKYASSDYASDGEHIGKIKEVNRFTRQHSVPEDIVVYRYTHRKSLKHLCSARILRKGMIFTEKGFCSTTLLKDALQKFSVQHECDCILKLYLPKGLPGVYASLDFPPSVLREYEILLAPNTQFEILKVHGFNRPLVVECRAILPGQTLR